MKLFIVGLMMVSLVGCSGKAKHDAYIQGCVDAATSIFQQLMGVTPEKEKLTGPCEEVFKHHSEANKAS